MGLFVGIQSLTSDLVDVAEGKPSLYTPVE